MNLPKPVTAPPQLPGLSEAPQNFEFGLLSTIMVFCPFPFESDLTPQHRLGARLSALRLAGAAHRWPNLCRLGSLWKEMAPVVEGRSS